MSDRILHKVVSGCLDCPAYYREYDDEDYPSHHRCTMGASGFPDTDFVAWPKIEDGWFAPDCPLKEQA